MTESVVSSTSVVAQSGGIKRAIDILGASLGLVILLPVFALLWLLIRSNLGAPVIFTQQRPGKDAKIFTLYKFRSMLEPDPARGILIDDQRITPFGRWLRNTSLDELPTLVNVLKGDMSLVGPRPLHVDYLERYTPHQARRHQVRPGITGLAQVRGRNTLDWEARFDLDVRYVQEHSLLLDFRLLMETIGQVFSRSGIEAEGAATMPIFTGSAPDDGLTEQLMSDRWSQLWQSWQQHPQALTSHSSKPRQHGGTRYWVYLDDQQAPVCIAGLSGLGQPELTVSLLLAPDSSDTWCIPAVLKRLIQHGRFYKAQFLILTCAAEHHGIQQAATQVGFATPQPTSAIEVSSYAPTPGYTLALTTETGA